ncbi:MAG: hypothetical protein L3J49_05500 [Desulfobulbaceae bacterium]|nr:hypothetical protein [Desulfobulbaceae bacterium]
MTNHLFNDNWIESGKQDEVSWKSDVLNDITGNGTVYLNCIEKWFSEYPGSGKEKNHLESSLKSPKNTDHRGAVNELSWWKFWTSRCFELNPIPTGNGATPDFILNLNEEESIIFEVTTLNPSQNKSCHELTFSQQNSVKRIIAKTEEKIKQFRYGTHSNIPAVLVLFNYNEWAGFGVKFPTLSQHNEFISTMPRELSGIIFLERYVHDGIPYFKKESISFSENPSACLSLPVINKSTLSSIFKKEDDWIICDKHCISTK